MGKRDDDKLSILTINLDRLREYIRTSGDPPFDKATFDGIVRLSDHVKLEIHKLRDIQEQEYQKSLMMGDIRNLLENSEDMAEKVRVAQMESEKLQMHMVAILGIFAAIVMAFSGGMNILGGAISISGDSDICNVVFTVLLCGVISSISLYSS